jgi:hypothetical protein
VRGAVTALLPVDVPAAATPSDAALGGGVTS